VNPLFKHFSLDSKGLCVAWHDLRIDGLNGHRVSDLWKRSLEITQLYRTFLVDPGHRGLLSIELGYAKETVSLLLSNLANPEAKPGKVEIPVTYSRIGEGTGAATARKRSGPGYGSKRRGCS
jgi:hypothetical protein